MGIVGDHPEGGIRFDLSRTTAEPPWVYEGSAYTREAEHRLRAIVTDGAVTIDGEEALPVDVAQRLKLLLRTASKHADGGAPPRRLHRWRAA